METVQRQNLENIETAMLTIKIPRNIHEQVRTQAFKERKSMSLLVTELLKQGLERKENSNDHPRT